MNGPDFLKKFDRTGRPPRQIQIDALNHLSRVWHTADVHVLSLSVGSGKAAIAEAVAAETFGHILNPSNSLLDQNIETYPFKNVLKGKTHYTCHLTREMSCQDWCELSGAKACDGCPYTEAKTLAQHKPTIFNPMSYWYYTKSDNFVAPKTLIVDEAHTLAQQMLSICGVSLKSSQYPFTDEFNDELRLVNWLYAQISRLTKHRQLVIKDRSKVAELTREIDQMMLTMQSLQEAPENFAIWTEQVTNVKRPYKILHIKPVKLPSLVSKQILEARKIILLSGTIFEPDIKELIGNRPYTFHDFGSPIPVENRLIHVHAVPFKLNYQTPPEKIAKVIETTIRRENPIPNTIVHVSYALQKKILPHLTLPVIYNNKEDKNHTIERFKKQGGIFFAAGCAEGLDLKNDLCRLNIIPKLLYPDLNDPVTQKRKALEDGDEWYALQTLKLTIQQAGRSTRGPQDWSKTVILDPNFTRLYRRYKKKLPRSFTDAIRIGSIIGV